MTGQGSFDPPPATPLPGPLRVRWLGRVAYREAWDLQRAIWSHSGDDYLLLMEHDAVYTLGSHADPAHILVDPATVGADQVAVDRGGAVTFHGPGQLVGYPIVSVGDGPHRGPDHVRRIEDLIVATLVGLGMDPDGVGRLTGYPGVWVGLDDPPGGAGPRKICAIGVRTARGRTLHGFALNVSVDLSMFGHIVPCGIADRPVTSLRAEGIGATMSEVVDAVVDAVVGADSTGWGGCPEVQRVTGGASSDRAEKVPAEAARSSVDGHGPPLARRLRRAGVDPEAGLPLGGRKPAWLRVGARMGDGYLETERQVRELGLVTVCQEAGCPNIYECWSERTATFMINGERCTRACGFCQVDTRRPLPLDPGEPDRVARAVERMGLAHAVVTCVARDDLADGGAAGFAATIAAVRRRSPGTSVEVLISDCKGDADALATIFQARPDVLNHNIETVARLQRAARPSAGYARSLTVLARAKDAGLATKSGIILGMGERASEVLATLADLRAVGVDIVTVGQYLRPSRDHLPVARWWAPEEFEELRRAALAMGFGHVQASPLTRSSYHAREATETVPTPPSRQPVSLVRRVS